MKRILRNNCAHSGLKSLDGADFASPAGRSLEKAKHTHTHTRYYSLSKEFISHV